MKDRIQFMVLWDGTPFNVQFADQLSQYRSHHSHVQPLGEKEKPLPTASSRTNRLELLNTEWLNCLDQLSTSTSHELVREQYITEDISESDG